MLSLGPLAALTLLLFGVDIGALGRLTWTYWDVWLPRDRPECANGLCNTGLHLPFTVRARSAKEAIYLALDGLPLETKRAIFDATGGDPFRMRALGLGRSWSHWPQFDMPVKLEFSDRDDDDNRTP